MRLLNSAIGKLNKVPILPDIPKIPELGGGKTTGRRGGPQQGVAIGGERFAKPVVVDNITVEIDGEAVGRATRKSDQRDARRNPARNAGPTRRTLMAVDASPGAGRVLIASGAGPLVAEPSWTRYDNLSACRCFGFDWHRGRQTEFDVTSAGTARVFFNDRDGTSTPTLPSGVSHVATVRPGHDRLGTGVPRTHRRPPQHPSPRRTSPDEPAVGLRRRFRLPGRREDGGRRRSVRSLRQLKSPA